MRVPYLAGSPKPATGAGGPLGRAAGRLVVVALVYGVWWYYTRPGRVSSLVLPPPDAVLRALPSLLVSTPFRSALVTTTVEVLLAFTVSVGAGMVIGVVVGSSRHWSAVVRPLLVWGQTVPIILLYPLCLLIFGVGPGSKIVFAGAYGAFPVALSTLIALSSCPESLRLMARSFGASRATIRLKVEFGNAWPVIVSGLRLAAALDMIGVLAGQMLGSTGGLGYEIISAENSFQTTQVYDLMIAVALLVLVFNGLITAIEAALTNRAHIRRWLSGRSRNHSAGPTLVAPSVPTPVGMEMPGLAARSTTTTAARATGRQ
ncbi:MAG: ABC transporter permease [Acidimicrobiales bacterium]